MELFTYYLLALVISVITHCCLELKGDYNNEADFLIFRMGVSAGIITLIYGIAAIISAGINFVTG